MSQSGFDAKTSPLVDPVSRTFADHEDLLRVRSEELRGLFPDIIGDSAAMQKVFANVYKIARSHSSVLILGESGTGKELIAAAIHRLSARADKRFSAINCSAVPDALLESELFGHYKGAFTGAVNRRLGLFEKADGGTIFLDEVGDMPANLQAKLLRVLQEKKFTPLGSTEEKTSDVRIIAATNIDLLEAVGNKQFRSDLYYRLNVLPVILPALRDRGSDVTLLLRHFLRVSNRMHGLPNPCTLSEQVTAHLQGYAWPGNVRQLQNLVERLVVYKSGGVIDLEDLPEELLAVPVKAPSPAKASTGGFGQEAQDNPREAAEPVLPRLDAVLHRGIPGSGGIRRPGDVGELLTQGFQLNTYIEDLENELILRALEITGNNRNRAAKLLGMNRTTLVERIKKRAIGAAGTD